MPWRATTTRNAIILNERLVRDDVLTSIHVKEYEIDARDTKLGARRSLATSEPADDIWRTSTTAGSCASVPEVEPGDILVGKVTPKVRPSSRPRSVSSSDLRERHAKCVTRH